MIMRSILPSLIGLNRCGAARPVLFHDGGIYMGIVYDFSFSFLLPSGYDALNSLTLLSVPFFIMAGLSCPRRV